MLKIDIPNSFLNERKYIFDVVFDTFFNFDFFIVPSARDDLRISDPGITDLHMTIGDVFLGIFIDRKRNVYNGQREN